MSVPATELFANMNFPQESHKEFVLKLSFKISSEVLS